MYMTFFDCKSNILDPDTHKNKGVTQAYRSVLMLTLMQPHGALFETFKTDLQKIALQMYGYTYGADEMVTHYLQTMITQTYFNTTIFSANNSDADILKRIKSYCY
ncbi:hypothetical protein KUTeg_020613 [Tegillarca granosa]|uniref:Uncharacterized protein n=1 Tax=Tegillarca granosa TaxID=220873 RepID=A0ABQ9E8E9_TEGGR|nr:hypothetical protein KUTeg_020613 [Tegillarca granosa]